ncbi:glycoside hydrolase family 3 protein [Arthrobacter tecti]
MAENTDYAGAINAVIWPGFLGTTVPEWLEAELRRGLAGVVLFANNIDPGDPEQLTALCRRIRKLNTHAIIGVDEEGGTVTRLEAATGSSVPGAAELGRIDREDITTAVGATLGRRARQAGINLLLAPVADVNTNPRNPVIGIRSFGSEPDLAAEHTAAMTRGIQSTGVGACAKHFPGHGDTVTDSHVDLPRVDLGLAELQAAHIPPFAAAIEAGTTAIMTAHIVVPELGDLPATLNPKAIGMLRELGFGGLVITDALDMGAVRHTYGSGEGAVLAMLAGADLLCVGNPANDGGTADHEDYLEVFEALETALRSGRLPLERLLEAGCRSAGFAAWTQEAHDDGGPADLSGLPSALQTNGDVRLPDGEVTVIDLRDHINMAAGAMPDVFSAALAEHRTLHYRKATEAGSGVPPSSSVVAIVDRAEVGSAQRAALAALVQERPDAVCINAGLPVDLDLPVINCFGASRPAAVAATAKLLGIQPS